MNTETEARISCEQADRLMDSHYGSTADKAPEPVSAHLRACSRCRELYGWILSGAPRGETGVEERLCERIGRTLQPVRPMPSTGVLTGRFLAVFAVLVVVMVAATGAYGPENMTLAQLLVVAAVLGVGAIFLSVSLSWQMVPGQGGRVPAPVLIGGFAAGFVVVVASTFPWEAMSEVMGGGWGCTRAGVLMSAPAAAILLWLVTRGAPLCYSMLGASLGATSGLLALTVLQLHCQNQHAGHLLIWHGGVVLLCTGFGYLLGRIAAIVASRRTGGLR